MLLVQAGYLVGSDPIAEKHKGQNMCHHTSALEALRARDHIAARATGETNTVGTTAGITARLQPRPPLQKSPISESVVPVSLRLSVPA